MGLEINGTNFVASSNIGKTSNVKTQSVQKPAMGFVPGLDNLFKMLKIEKYIDEIVNAKYPITDSVEKNKEREAYRATIVEFFKTISPEYKAWKELNDRLSNIVTNKTTENKTDNNEAKKFEVIS